ncbi:sodium-coupled monocarboxylate transporter 2-like [Argopecten irradians]|uniref:sodium-coupled monocarboxylate transporter 2-like n=1 Tax=Argopecten irradians TaxID=31199 RepID=UPI00372158BC
MIFVGIAAVTIKGSVLMETCHGVIEIATAGRRLEFVNIDPDPRSRHTIWGTCIGLTFTFLFYWCNQSSFQRMSSLSSLRKTQLAFWLLCPMIIIYFILLGYLGILVYSYYNTVMCDPVEGGFLSNFNQLMPFFVLDVLRSLPGLSGVYISCLFSGTLSTLSSGINSMSAITVKDIFGTCVRHPTAISQTCTGKILVIVYGLIVIALAYVISSMSGSVIQIFAVVSGACGAGPLAGLFFLGGMVPKANWIGAIVGSLASIFCTSWLALGAQIYGTQPERLAHNPTSGCSVNNIKSVINKTQINKTTFDTYGLNGSSSVSADGQVISYSSNAGFSLYDLSYTWYGFIGFFLTLIVGTIVSLCTGGDGGNSVETRLIFPIFRKVFGLHTDTIDETEEMREMKLSTTIKTDSNSKALAERVKPSDIPPRTNRSKTLGYQCDMYGLVHPIAINGTPTMEND